MAAVGCIGLGLLGSALAGRLIERGRRVIGFDVDRDRCDEFAACGGIVAESASRVLQCDQVLLSLPTSEIVRDVVLSLRNELRPGLVIIDTTTGRPADVESLGAELRSRQVDLVDATVGGSSELARRGEAIFMCGGEATAIAQCRPLLSELSDRVFHLGPIGSGSRMKLVLNLVLGLNRAVLAEGLSFARSQNIAPRQALEVLQAGPSYSRAMDHKGLRMIDENFEPQARLAQHLKDVLLILETGSQSAADRTVARLPFSELHAELLQQCVDAGLGDLDNSAIIRAFSD